jgi:hypothetical protein
MNNVKKISLYAVIIVAATMPNSSKAGWLAEKFKQWFPGVGVAMVKAGDKTFSQHKDTVLKASEKLGADGFQQLANGINQAAGTLGDKVKEGMVEGMVNAAQNVDPTLGNQAASILGDKIKEASPMFGRDAAEILAPALKGVGAGLAVYGVYKLASAAGNVYTYLNPDQETLDRREEARKRNHRSRLERGLMDCLINNARTPRNDAGIPTVCDDFSAKYRMVAGQSSVDEMTNNFKEAYKE